MHCFLPILHFSKKKITKLKFHYSTFVRMDVDIFGYGSLGIFFFDKSLLCRICRALNGVHRSV